jgi:hypothetical protein
VEESLSALKSRFALCIGGASRASGAESEGAPLHKPIVIFGIGLGLGRLGNVKVDGRAFHISSLNASRGK